MAQNIYDDEEFFVAYSGLRRSVEGLDGAPEWPTLRAMLPTMAGCRVVDLGCGFGWFSRWAAEAGAASVLGIDLSDKMLARAAARHDDDRDHLSSGTTSTSSSFQPRRSTSHTARWRCTTSPISTVPGDGPSVVGRRRRFVFSIEHPIYTAPSKPGLRHRSRPAT